MDKRYLQANKEAKLSLYITVCYLICWSFFAYFSYDEIGIFGLPLWFELSCIFAPISFIIVCSIVVKYLFKDISLEIQADKKTCNE
ncbi:putative membrane protein YhdT [Orbus hercynius]|uniref:Putative membrane protein YhdT n=1 Tax=Orbus hercynius TaxID=593135 RepID=A0A495RI28_9GAMM|nr:putative membrane protein YhdT [Orbus hercynius]